LEDHLLLKDWRPEPPVPYTLIIDDTDLDTVPTGQIHLPPVKYNSPVDAFTWGQLSDSINLWVDRIQANDTDTFAINSNLFGVDTRTPAYGSISRERLMRCTPPLPRWLLVGLLGKDCGIFRESFAPSTEDYYEMGHFGSDRAFGPGTLWVSLKETKRLLELFEKEKADKKTEFWLPPLERLFTEDAPPAADLILWESEAALFIRWALVGPGRQDPFMAHAFDEFVRRARREPVTEQVFADCFGFRYSDMERKLGAFLRAVLAKPTSVFVKFPDRFPSAQLEEATADQIGRILGDWLRMQGDSLRKTDPDLSRRVLFAAGRMLERAYRADNGLPPDIDPSPEGERSADPLRNAAYGPPVAMKPLVVSAARIHDPGLLAVYGLYEHDIGNIARAREFLEAAAKAGAGRPRAYLVLAELRFAEAIARPQGSRDRLSALQAAAVLDPLGRALQYPPVLDSYRLLVETWAHCDTKPADSDVERMVEGVALFPRNVELAYRSAQVCAQGSYIAQAAGLVRSGLVFAANKEDRKNLEQLRSALGADAKTGAK
jgi:hypothetical protein